jgi:hypothetical protein
MEFREQFDLREVIEFVTCVPGLEPKSDFGHLRSVKAGVGGLTLLLPLRMDDNLEDISDTSFSLLFPIAALKLK